MIPIPEKLIHEAAKRAQQRLTEHIERFAAAYIKLTDIPADEAVMMSRMRDDGTQMIWFERKTNADSEAHTQVPV